MPYEPLVTIPNRTVFLLRAITAATGISDGYDLGVINGVSMILSKSHGYTSFEISMFVAIMPLFVGVGAFLGGFFADSIGRKKVLISSYVLLIAGAVMMGVPDMFPLLLIGRSVVGLGIGIGAVVGTVYMAEISPTKNRGSIVAQEALFLSAGLLLGYVSNYAFLGFEGFTHDYNLMLGIGALLPALCLATLLLFGHTLPESPYYERMDKESDSSKFSNFFSSPGSTSALLVGLLQPLSGIGPILYFSDITFSTIDKSAEGESDVAVSSIWIGLVKFCVLSLSTFVLMDKLNRRTMLLASSFMLVCSMGFLAVVLQSGNGGVLLLTGFCAAVGSYAFGWNCVPSVYPSELLPTHVRAFGIAFATIIGRVVAVTNSFLYPLVGLEHLSVWFWTYMGINAVSFALVFRFAEETLHKPLIAKSGDDSERTEILHHVD